MRFGLSRKTWLPVIALSIFSIYLIVPFLQSALHADDGARQTHRLEGTYHWAKKSYNDRRFRSAEKKLKQLLSYIDVNGAGEFEYGNLRRRTLLLLAEVSEKIGKKKAAASYRQQARALTAKLKK